jgi:Spherulation-specific family 4
MVRARSIHAGRWVSVAGVVLAWLVLAAPVWAQSMAVPAYFYPGQLWTQMDGAGSGLQIAVMNPDSGPGSAPDANYVSAVKAAEAQGITVLGYVYTSYASRSLSAVEADVNDYYNWYGVNGIFFDEASTSCTNSNYYSTLNAFVKAKGGTARTILNPGTQTSSCYINDADILLTFEGSDSQYVSSYSAPSWVAGYPASHFWHVIYDTPSVSTMAQAVQLSQSRGAGYVYVTTANLPNPYDLLPTGSYWSSELTDIANTGGGSSGGSTGSGSSGGSTGGGRRGGFSGGR